MHIPGSDLLSMDSCNPYSSPNITPLEFATDQEYYVLDVRVLKAYLVLHTWRRVPASRYSPGLALPILCNLGTDPCIE